MLRYSSILTSPKIWIQILKCAWYIPFNVPMFHQLLIVSFKPERKPECFSSQYSFDILTLTLATSVTSFNWNAVILSYCGIHFLQSLWPLLRSIFALFEETWVTSVQTTLHPKLEIDGRPISRLLSTLTPLKSSSSSSSSVCPALSLSLSLVGKPPAHLLWV